MLVKDFINGGGLFTYMSVGFLSPTDLVNMDHTFQAMYGNRTCNSLVDSYTVNGTISPSGYNGIARTVQSLNIDKWNRMNAFNQAALDPWFEGETKVFKNYGKEQTSTYSGTDSVSRLNKISGFDSANFVDDTSKTDTTTFGKVISKANSGRDDFVTTKRTTQAEQLMSSANEYWSKEALYRSMLADACRDLTLPLYDFDD